MNEKDYYLSDNGGVSTVWEVPFLMAIGSLFNHEYGIYKVTSYEGDNVMCDRIVNSVVFSSFDRKLDKYGETNKATLQRAKFIIQLINETDIELSVKLADWIENGSTVKLKEILLTTPFYDERNLIDFNAFTLLDSAR
jgi:hypothetical protein